MTWCDVWCPSCRRKIVYTKIDEKIKETLFYCLRCKTEFIFAKFEAYTKSQSDKLIGGDND